MNHIFIGVQCVTFGACTIGLPPLIYTLTHYSTNHTSVDVEMASATKTADSIILRFFSDLISTRK